MEVPVCVKTRHPFSRGRWRNLRRRWICRWARVQSSFRCKSDRTPSSAQSLFYPSSSLFCKVGNVYERLPTGQVVTAVDVRSLSLYPSVSAKSSYEVCQLLFLIVIVVYLIAEMVKFFRYKSYLFQIWNWLELVLLVVSVVAVMLSLFKAKETSLDERRIQSNPYKGSSSDTIARLLAIETVWLLIAIFLTTLKLLQLIRFNPHICHWNARNFKEII